MKHALDYMFQMEKVFKDKNYSLLGEMFSTLAEKIEILNDELENMTKEKDEQYDRAENLQEMYGHIDEEEAAYLQDHCFSTMREVHDKWINDEIVEYNEEERTAIELSQDLKLSYERLRLGVNTEIDNIIQTTNKLIEIYL